MADRHGHKGSLGRYSNHFNNHSIFSPGLSGLPSHWGGNPLAISSMAGPMQTPPSSPPMSIERFG